MRELVLGDIHGGYKGLKQVFKRSNFDYEKDKLIFLGDVADGWSQTFECMEELLKIKNLIFIIGNHDYWLLDCLEYGRTPAIWTKQGGKATIESYLNNNNYDRWSVHRDLLRLKTLYYYIDEKNRVFVHGGISLKNIHPKDTDKDFLMWDRNLFRERHNLGDVDSIKKFKEIYVGHTTTWNISKFPLNCENVWFMDQGGGFEGKISLMDINTKEFWQSDKLNTIYRDEHGRM